MPCQSGLNLADSGAGYMCALSIVAALLQAEREGVGQRIEMAMQDVRVGNGMPLEDVAPAGM